MQKWSLAPVSGISSFLPKVTILVTELLQEAARKLPAVKAVPDSGQNVSLFHAIRGTYDISVCLFYVNLPKTLV